MSKSNLETHSPNLPFQTARRIGNCAIDRALKEGRMITVCIVNRQGQVIFFACMDGVAPATESIATLKARQSAYVGKRTSVTIKEIEAGPITADLLGLKPSKVMPYAGGVPIYTEEAILIGGLGISGLKQEEDEDYAIEAVAFPDVESGFFSEKPVLQSAQN